MKSMSLARSAFVLEVVRFPIQISRTNIILVWSLSAANIFYIVMLYFWRTKIINFNIIITVNLEPQLMYHKLNVSYLCCWSFFYNVRVWLQGRIIRYIRLSNTYFQGIIQGIINGILRGDLLWARVMTAKT
jgi:hypothetical protein